MIDFIGIGAARSGTTWISEVLRGHPEIGLSEPKEVRYFNRLDIPHGREPGRPNPQHGRSIEWYLRHFGAAGRVKGEFTPLYLYDRAAAESIERLCPRVKLLCILRHPADRAYSHYWLYRGSGTLPEMSFEVALEAEPVLYEMGFYARQLGRYLKRFERGQMLVLTFDDLVADPEGQIARVLGFLGVRDDLSLTSGKRNRPATVRPKKLERAAHAVSRGMASAGLSGVVRGLRNLGVHDLVRRLMSSESRYPPMAAETRRRLIESYTGDVTALEGMLDRDLSAWKTTGRDAARPQSTTPGTRQTAESPRA